jgi:hypothetical protein
MSQTAAGDSNVGTRPFLSFTQPCQAPKEIELVN